MKATITSDGTLELIPENSIEDFALSNWWMKFSEEGGPPCTVNSVGIAIRNFNENENPVNESEFQKRIRELKEQRD